MNQILLHPTDILFFRDGRPMSGSSSGHGAAWPLPNVLSGALHAALHRARLDAYFKMPVHKHRLQVAGSASDERERLFGSLNCCGPFPVHVAAGESVENGGAADLEWLFPRPADAGDGGAVFLQPVKSENGGSSSLPVPCMYPVASARPPSKVSPKAWWNRASWDGYLNQSEGIEGAREYRDSDIGDTEHSYGIEIDPSTGTVVSGQFYSAQYLRLRADWRMGMLALAEDKAFSHPEHGNDLVAALLNGGGGKIIVGGQQRLCTATRVGGDQPSLPLPMGPVIQGNLVKWVLLSPAIWPAMAEGTNADGDPIHPHPGGWLPNWIAANDHELDGEVVEAGTVLLYDGPGKRKAMRKRVQPGRRIGARLVASIVPKAIPVTGYALPNEAAGRIEGGAKSTHLAVPAGAVYYFECADNGEAKKLAAALNWHGTTPATQIRNRRSTLMGEKGFGLGVCGTWNFHQLNPQT